MAEAHGLPLSIATISMYLRAQHGKPTHRTLCAFSRLLGIPLAQLLSVAKLPPPHDDYLWTPPREAWQLSRQQGDAVNAFIKALADGATAVAPAAPARRAPEYGYTIMRRTLGLKD
ncbi:hypothetical protein ONR57_08230 [Hoyosella sp. YIM 151337]|uniref:hypothetical protein n=1 Tax=Hoyosella sp. YIM 151337 TaxID=2992742 RepID=UPI0022357FCA|nr:hypothetical protein [Hoyosella sp. YIM 151337]MCW4353281.1 hypothetical protein [Hoyosella sp. YIM 151337]